MTTTNSTNSQVGKYRVS